MIVPRLNIATMSGRAENTKSAAEALINISHSKSAGGCNIGLIEIVCCFELVFKFNRAIIIVSV